MNKFNSIVLAAAIVGAAMALQPPAVLASGKAPVGYAIFCLKNPDHCRSGSAGSVAMTDQLMTQLKRVNASVNRSIRPANERRGRDVWTVGASVGDCEDYVLTKRARLISMGVPAGALRIAHAKTRRGEDHAVLVVMTSRGDLVLDNLTGAIKPMSQTGLRFISMSGANPAKWSAI